jgi:hypothetical protein
MFAGVTRNIVPYSAHNLKLTSAAGFGASRSSAIN